ncbi:TetR/AcrR family transcriptional regulator [Paenibacillus sp. 23TSA30-6]|uniref:TetR/AcrR family transcriptional regulator n=1 Tax=Paenibacillus sp. 23TSA30-6 TaxID=2546104 RepID=UPI001787AAE3|nr:TetR/AcrR family transcriptional regulator [Paenibacillus sp. 23TSA30-6]
MGVKIDRRILKTKEAIFNAFIGLISEKDFEEITINEIADRANVNRGTIYFHYTDKYDLLNKCIDEHLSKMISICISTDPNQEKVNFIHSLLPVFQYFEQNHTFYASMLSNKGIPAFREHMLEIVAGNIKDQVNMEDLNKGHDKQLITQFMAFAFTGVIEWWILNNMPHPPKYMAEQVWGLFERNQIYRS